MAQVGRISGPLLQANLERNGIDLAFRNDLSTTQLLYLDVNNGKIGVNNATPTKELDVLDTIQTTNLIGTNSVSRQSRGACRTKAHFAYLSLLFKPLKRLFSLFSTKHL